jgi:hypothetical protein
MPPSTFTSTIFTPLPPVLSEAVPCIVIMLVREMTVEPFLGLVIMTEGAVVSFAALAVGAAKTWLTISADDINNPMIARAFALIPNSDISSSNFISN